MSCVYIAVLASSITKDKQPPALTRGWCEFILPKCCDGSDTIGVHARRIAADRWLCVLLMMGFLAAFAMLRYGNGTHDSDLLANDAPYLLIPAFVCFLRFRVVDWMYLKYWYDEGTRTRRATARYLGGEYLRQKARDYETIYRNAMESTWQDMRKGGRMSI